MRLAIPIVAIAVLVTVAGGKPVAPMSETLPESAEVIPDARYPEVAERIFRAVLDRIDSGTDDAPELIAALNGLGTALVLQGEAGEARAWLERALRIQDHATQRGKATLATTLHALARSYVLLGLRDDAARLFLREEAIRAEAGERAALARVRRELARLEGYGRSIAPLSLAARREFETYDDDGTPLTGKTELDEDLVLRLHLLRLRALAAERTWRNDRASSDARHAIADFYFQRGDEGEALDWRERAWNTRPPEHFRKAYRAFRVFPDRKAMAVAIDAEGRYTYGFFTGESSLDDAQAKALRECRGRLSVDRVDADCRLYAEDDRMVWRARSSTVQR